ncbi:Ubiquitin carboxyl-terminal hydrolase 16 [Madurella mycetomatis]|uniref:Ubiquitin carboxyl-terminal hydrolase n=1 Tax=Madurella mycetomatis TaxID=100816 RepID=A0A175WDH1_9PEZI|nr:Ubiquitin carboxyl-terminal hydrolase 16 [Madurella mycetomatis]
MSDKTLKVVTYAAGASLAAITLVYVFGPTYFLDSDPSKSSSGAFSSRKNGVVGLSNPANDCFINSVLQALAGLGDLRLYLIQEVHRRSLDDSVYRQPVPPGTLVGEETGAAPLRLAKDIPHWKLEGLQKGTVTKSLKEILDALNERPIYKKTISAAPFVRALEDAFGQRISRQQQDAQEFLQVVAERLCDEYHAGRRARSFARQVAVLDNRSFPKQPAIIEPSDEANASLRGAASQAALVVPDMAARAALGGTENGQDTEDEDGFPLEGKFESQIECLTCGFKPRPTESTFCTLTLNVPQVQATTLGACFDGMFKTEFIDDFKCEKCRLVHAVTLFESEAKRSSSDAAKVKAQAAVEALRLAIDTDPEKPPEDVTLPGIRHAPKRRIARHIRLTRFPKILAIHLSRSIFDASRTSLKNSAKVAFPEQLPLGGLLQQRKYKLLGVVTHKGSHHSGHYESFRRQNIYPPFSNPNTFQPSGVYSKATSPASTPRIKAIREGSDRNALTPTRYSLASGSGPNSSRPSIEVTVAPAGVSGTVHAGAGDGGNSEASTRLPAAHSPAEGNWDKNGGPSTAASTAVSPRLSPSRPPSTLSSRAGNTDSAQDLAVPAQPAPAAKSKQQRKAQARWWRISDEKVKEASTRDVLGMQREVYLLFYELERARS